jgi:hypothetical protein
MGVAASPGSEQAYQEVLNRRQAQGTTLKASALEPSGNSQSGAELSAEAVCDPQDGKLYETA